MTSIKEGSKQNFDWNNHISIVDSSISELAIANIVKIDSEMLVHMNNLQECTQKDLTKFSPVIVAQFTPGGGKFTLLRSEYGNESRKTVEPVPSLFALAKSIAHAPLGIFGCFGPYSTTPLNQGWRKPLKSYLKVIEDALKTLPNVKLDTEIDNELKHRLVTDLNQVTGKFDDAPPHLTLQTVLPHINEVLRQLMSASIDFIKDQALPLAHDQSPAAVFQHWCNQTSNKPDNPDDTLYKLIVQCQVIAATTQQYGISILMKKWRGEFTEQEWNKLYVIVEGEWVTRKMNSIAQCILPEMADKQYALDENLLIVTNLSDIESALHFLARILEDRAAADMILTDHSDPREHLSGQVDLLGPVMRAVVCPHHKRFGELQEL